MISKDGSSSAYPPMSWTQIVAYCSTPVAAAALQVAGADLAQAAQDLGVPQPLVERQFLLHLPSLALSESPDGTAPMLARAIAAVRSRLSSLAGDLSNYLRDVLPSDNAQLFSEVQFNPRQFRLETDTNSSFIAGGGRRWNVEFREVDETTARCVEERLHYLQSFRNDAVKRVGLYVAGARKPFCYASFSQCDRPYIFRPLHEFLKGELASTELLCLTRLYGIPGVPWNSISGLIALASKSLEPGIQFIETAINPYLKFSGVSFRASGFVPYALAPVAYSYSHKGIYRTRRQGEDVVDAKWEAPANVLLVRGVNTKARKRIAAAEGLYRVDSALHSELFRLVAINLNVALEDIRSNLESAWDSNTIYRKTRLSPSDPVSKGQCGVSSAYLAREFGRQGIDALFCQGDLHFPDNTPPILNHCWLRIPAFKQGESHVRDLIVDITADQTGFRSAVICEPAESLRVGRIRYETRSEDRPENIDVLHLWHRLEQLQHNLQKADKISLAQQPS